MKYIAVAALLGMSDAFLLGDNQEKLYEDIQIDDVNFLQTGKIIEKGDEWSGWRPHMDNFPGTVNEYGNFMDKYDRVKPVRFVG
jgi:hypothetical protein